MAKNFDSRMTLEHLEEQHRTLDRQVEYLHRRAHLTPAEQQAASDLKRRKLAMKDAISMLRGKLN